MKVETDYVHYHLQDAYLLANQEPILGHYIKEIGFIKRSRIPDLFCALVHTIIAQLISSEAANKIWQRMQEQFLITPEYLSTLSIDEIKQMGLTYNKAKAIHNLSLKIINHEFNLKLIHTLSNEQAIDYLTQLDGIGVWSAKMILLHVLERPNIISYEDKAILNAMKKTREDTWCMDLGEVSFGEEKRLFAISAGIGLDALVCKKALKSKIKDLLNKIRLGKLTYLVLTVQSLFTMQTADAELIFDQEEGLQKRGMIFTAAMNFKAEGGGVPMAPAASARDGKLSFCEAAGIPKWRTFLCLPFLVAAKHTSIKGFSVTDAKECTIRLNRPMVVHADGEYCGEVAKVHFRCLPGKLRVLK